MKCKNGEKKKFIVQYCMVSIADQHIDGCLQKTIQSDFEVWTIKKANVNFGWHTCTPALGHFFTNGQLPAMPSNLTASHRGRAGLQLATEMADWLRREFHCGCLSRWWPPVYSLGRRYIRGQTRRADGQLDRGTQAGWEHVTPEALNSNSSFCQLSHPGTCANKASMDAKLRMTVTSPESSTLTWRRLYCFQEVLCVSPLNITTISKRFAQNLLYLCKINTHWMLLKT